MKAKIYKYLEVLADAFCGKAVAAHDYAMMQARLNVAANDVKQYKEYAKRAENYTSSVVRQMREEQHKSGAREQTNWQLKKENTRLKKALAQLEKRK